MGYFDWYCDQTMLPKDHPCSHCKEGTITYNGYKCDHYSCGLYCERYPARNKDYYTCSNKKCDNQGNTY